MNIILKNGSGEIEEKKSRFICHIFKIKSEEEAEEYITAVKKKYWDARHNCYAYVTGDKGQIQRFSDDGEPQGTAGKPMLDILNSYGLTDCLLVVTRYFGGVLLGTGGLIRAYQAAAKEGIKNSDIAQVCDGITAVITTDYNAYGKLQYICNDNNVDIIDTDFGANVTIKLAAEMSVCDTFEKKLMEGLAEYTDPKEGCLECMDKLREHGIRIGSTTGYTHAMMDVVEKEAAAKGYHPDLLVTPEDVEGNGRPKPYMIFRNMQLLQAEDVRKVMKVGDTASDMKEGKNAGVYTVGVLEGSSALGMSQEEFEGLTGQEQQKELDRAKKILMDAGADRVIRSLKELPHIIFS